MGDDVRQAATRCVLAASMIALDPPLRTDVVRVAIIAAGVGIVGAAVGIGAVRWLQRRRRNRVRRWVR